jgi:hypothetical protein
MNFGPLETGVKNGVDDFLDIISRSPIMIGFAVLVVVS